MGTVYEAVDQRLRNTVAIKETRFTDERLRKQFEREAELLAGLHHPALPSVSDHFIEDDGQFLVMRFISGDDLAKMLEERGHAFPIEDVLAWGDQLLDALDYLHTQDPPIVHRDIKPQNLKVTERGQIILLDFGLAKGSIGMMSKIVTTGSIFGFTPNFAPLEQIQGTGTGPHSDLYSLAATLYHLATNVIPPDALSRASSIIGGMPDPLLSANEVNARVPEKVAAVFQKGMGLHPSQRYSTAFEMRQALKDAAKPSKPTEHDAKTWVLPSPTIASQEPVRKSVEPSPTITSPALQPLATSPENISPSFSSTPPAATAQTNQTLKSVLILGMIVITISVVAAIIITTTGNSGFVDNTSNTSSLSNTTSNQSSTSSNTENTGIGNRNTGNSIVSNSGMRSSNTSVGNRSYSSNTGNYSSTGNYGRSYGNTANVITTNSYRSGNTYTGNSYTGNSYRSGNTYTGNMRRP